MVNEEHETMYNLEYYRQSYKKTETLLQFVHVMA